MCSVKVCKNNRGFEVPGNNWFPNGSRGKDAKQLVSIWYFDVPGNNVNILVSNGSGEKYAKTICSHWVSEVPGDHATLLVPSEFRGKGAGQCVSLGF